MKYKTGLLAVLSGILLALPWTYSVFFFTIFCALIPLLILEEESHKQSNPYWLFNYSFLAFLIWNTLAYWWVSEAQLIGSILIILINSAIQATVFWLISITRKQLKIPILIPFLIIGLGFEYFHTQWDLAWPWLNLGNAFAAQPKLIQWYEFTGVRGGSLWIILINIVLYSLFKRRNYKNLIGTIILFVKSLKKDFKFDFKSLLGGLILGVVNYGSIYFLLKALQFEGLESSSIFTVNNVAIVMLSTIVGLVLFKEHISKKNWIGIAIAIISILLVTLA